MDLNCMRANSLIIYGGIKIGLLLVVKNRNSWIISHAHLLSLIATFYIWNASLGESNYTQKYLTLNFCKKRSILISLVWCVTWSSVFFKAPHVILIRSLGLESEALMVFALLIIVFLFEHCRSSVRHLRTFHGACNQQSACKCSVIKITCCSCQHLLPRKCGIPLLTFGSYTLLV